MIRINNSSNKNKKNRSILSEITDKLEEIKLSQHEIKIKLDRLEHRINNVESNFSLLKSDVELLQAKKIYTEAHQGNVEVINPTSTLNNRAAIFEDEEPIPFFKNF